MAGVGFLQRLWENPIWEGVWLFAWIRWIVCVYAQRPRIWNVPGTYGSHGELFFFLIQKEPATVPVGETFGPFFNADIRTPHPSPLFSADVLKKFALIALHVMAEEAMRW